MKKFETIFKKWGCFVGQEPVKEKNTLLKYLKSFKPSWVTSGFVQDRVTNEQVVNHYNVGYEYDGFTWNEEHIYHFEKYNMPLNEKFVKYVLTKNT